MNLNKIAVRYAKALYKLSDEKGILDEVREDVGLIAKVCKDVGMFMIYMESPVMKAIDKLQITQKIFKQELGKECMNFLELVIANKREAFLPDMVRNFEDIYRKANNIKHTELVSVKPLDNKLRDELTQIIQKQFDAKIELHERTEPGLLGGFILRVEDQQYDASMSRRLKELKRKLVSGAKANVN